MRILRQATRDTLTKKTRFAAEFWTFRQASYVLGLILRLDYEQALRAYPLSSPCQKILIFGYKTLSRLHRTTSTLQAPTCFSLKNKGFLTRVPRDSGQALKEGLQTGFQLSLEPVRVDSSGRMTEKYRLRRSHLIIFFGK